MAKVRDTSARNLISRLLSKDPQRRPDAAAVLAHPFLSGRAVSRMVGDPASFDVFLSYRVASDSDHVQLLYNMLTVEKGLRVWWDKKCLKNGVPWEEGFCDGLVRSRAVVCLLSADAIAHPANPRQSFAKLTGGSACDNVLLELQLALALRGLGLVDFIFPVLIGKRKVSATAEYESFDFSVMKDMPDLVVGSVVEKMNYHLDRQALGNALCPDQTVKETLALILANQGGFIRGLGETSFSEVAASIHAMCSTPSAPVSSVVASHSTAEGGTRELKALIGEMSTAASLQISSTGETQWKRLLEELNNCSKLLT